MKIKAIKRTKNPIRKRYIRNIGIPSQYSIPKPVFSSKVNYWGINMDTDKDGIPDRIDCAPFNPRKHSIEPNKEQAKRIKKLPIYVKERGVGPYHVLSKEAELYAPEARTELLSTIKHYPQFLGEIERAIKEGIFSSDWKYIYEKQRFSSGLPAINLIEDISRQRQFKGYTPSDSNYINPFTVFKDKYSEKQNEVIERLNQEKKGSLPSIFSLGGSYQIIELNSGEKINYISSNSSATKFLNLIKKRQPYHVSELTKSNTLSTIKGIVGGLQKTGLVLVFGESEKDFFMELTEKGENVLNMLNDGDNWSD